MGVRDALLLNQTGSNFQALQTDDTARLKGDLSLQKDDGTEVLGIDVSTATLNLTGGITGSGNISSSLSSTGSFGRVVATTFHGDGSALSSTLPRSAGIVTQSAQLAAQISGAFTAGFEMSASISGSATSTGSFGRVEGEFFFGDGSAIKTTIPRSTGILTSSAQIASNISGSFNKGFEFTGTIQAKPSGWDSWATHQPLITGRAALGGKGSRNAAIAVAGTANYAAPHSEADQMGHYYFSGDGVTCTEEWNGTSWTEVNDMIDSGPTGYGGTTEAGYAMGRSHPLSAQTEEWNGTNWSEGPAVDAGSAGRRSDAGGCSPSQIYLIGGYGSQGAAYFTTFDGSSFTAEPNMTSVYHFGRNGHSGNASSALAWSSSCRKSNGECTNLWNGSSWSEVAALPKIIDRGTGAGTVNDSYAYGGRCATEAGPAYGQGHCDTFLFWNGTSWSEQTDIPTPSATGHNEPIGVGAGSSDVFIFGGKEFTGVGNDYMAASASLMYNDFIASASFGRLEATTITGDASPISNQLPFPPGLISGSSGIASDVSGSFNKGFGLTGNITTPMDAWSTGHDMNTGRYYFGAKGYVDAAFAAGGGIIYGSPYGSDTMTGVTELWDGTSWTEVNDMSYGRTGGYGGTVESGYFSAGGAAPWSRTEEWNGTNWSEAPAFGERNGDVGGCSPTQVYNVGSMYDGGQKFAKYNAGVCTEGPILSIGTCAPFYTKGAGDSFGHAGNADCLLVFTCGFTEEYNGTSWSVLSHNIGDYNGRNDGFTSASPNPAKLHGSAPNLTCSVRGNTGAGTTNDAYSYGGEVGPISGPAYYQGCKTAMFQRWDGVSWSRGIIPPDYVVNARGVGDGSNAFVLGGRALRYPSYQTGVISSGSIFLEGQSSASFGLLTFVSASGNAKSLQSQLPYTTNPAFNVLTGSGQIASQISGSFNKGFEFSGQIKGVTGGVISLGDSLIEAQTGATGGSMNKGTAFVAGGVYGTSRETCACHQQYNGTSWSEAADLNDARKCDIIASGHSPGAIVHGGPSGPATVNGTEEWNGSAWSEVNTFYPARNVTVSVAGAGESSEAALRWGLYDAAEWNGTNWSEFQTTAESGLDGGHYNQAGTGTANAALQFAGQTPHNYSSTGYDRSFRAFRAYDGSNWSECPNMIFMTQGMGSFGGANDAVVTGGNIMRRTVDGAPGPFGCINHAANFHPSLFSRSWHNQYWNGSTWSISGRLLCRVVGCDHAGSGFGGASGGGDSNQGFIAGGITPSSPYTTTSTQLFDEVPVSGSFGRLDATTFHGDGSGLTNVLPSGLVSGSAQLGVSGSFTSGFAFHGEISGSATSTGSFGRIESDFLHGDGTSISGSLPRSTGIVSGAAQIAADISGSFTSGFGYDGLIQTTPGGVFQASDNLPTSATGGTAGSMVAGNAIQASGIVSPFPYKGAQTQLYNGSSWSEVNDQISARDANGTTLVGTSAAALLFGGCSDGSTEEWNGTNWSEVNDGDTSMRDGQGTGESSEAAIFTHYAGGNNVEWNGTNWSEIANAGQQRYTAGMIGSRDSALLFGGYSGAQEKHTELWNGSSWSELNDMLEEFNQGFGFGSSNDGVAVGGNRPPIPGWPGGSTPSGTSSQLWNGTSWSTGPNMNTGRHQRFGYGGSQMTPSGVSNEGFVAGGSAGAHPHIQAATEIFPANVGSASFHNIEVTTLTGDGSSLSASLQTQLLTGSSQIATYVSGSFNKGFTFEGGSTLTSAFYVGVSGSVSSSRGPESSSFFGSDYDPSIRYSRGNQTRTRGSSGAWKDVAPPVNICNQLLSGFGHKDAFLLAGDGAKVEEFDGTSWTVKHCMNFAHGYSAPNAYIRKAPSAGTVYAGLVTGGCVMGFNSPTEHGYKDTLIYNGSNWAFAGQQTVTHGREQGPTGHGMDGTQNAAILAGGRGPAVYACTELFNGTNWTEVADQQEATYDGSTVGTTNAAHLVGGRNSSHSGHKVHQCWDGSSWSYRTSVPGHHKMGAAGGVAEDFIVSSQDHIYYAHGQVQRWDGTSWASVGGAYQTRRELYAGDGTSVDLLIAGGRTVPAMSNTNCTEVWEEESYPTSSFGRLQTNIGGAIETDMFNISGSTMKLPTFSDVQIDTADISPQEGTSSIEPVVNVFQKPGSVWFHSDKNALGFTYVSSSVYSQSIDFVTCFYTSGSLATSSQGFITQSHYCYKNVIQYITGSYT